MVATVGDNVLKRLVLAFRLCTSLQDFSALKSRDDQLVNKYRRLVCTDFHYHVHLQLVNRRIWQPVLGCVEVSRNEAGTVCTETPLQTSQENPVSEVKDEVIRQPVYSAECLVSFLIILRDIVVDEMKASYEEDFLFQFVCFHGREIELRKILIKQALIFVRVILGRFSRLTYHSLSSCSVETTLPARIALSQWNRLSRETTLHFN